MKATLLRLGLCLAIGAVAGFGLARAFLAQGDIHARQMSEITSLP